MLSVFDFNRAGFLDRTDFKCAFIFLIGVKPSKSEVATMLKLAGISLATEVISSSSSIHNESASDHQSYASFSLTLSQFTAVVLPYVRRRTLDDDIKDMFDALDVQHCGFVSRSDFRAAVATVRATETASGASALAPPSSSALSASAVDRAFTDLDSKGYGRVSLRQFGMLVRERQQKQQPHQLTSQKAQLS